MLSSVAASLTRQRVSLLHVCCGSLSTQVFNEKTPLDDDAKPQDSMSKGLTDKLNWMKVRSQAACQHTGPRQPNCTNQQPACVSFCLHCGSCDCHGLSVVTTVLLCAVCLCVLDMCRPVSLQQTRC